jgi:hypothetical protein
MREQGWSQCHEQSVSTRSQEINTKVITTTKMCKNGRMRRDIGHVIQCV